MKIMKKLFLYLAIPFSLQAQSDSLKVTFSEEKVEKFEKTTLIDEYEKAFGGNRVVKSGLRMRFLSQPIFGQIDAFQTQYEQKLCPSFSTITKLGLSNSSMNPNFELEVRKYKNVKISNISGKYTSLFINTNTYSQPQPSNQNDFSSIGSIFIHSAGSRDYYFSKGALGISKGVQFANALAFGIKAGFKFGNKSFIDSRNNWVYGGKSNLTVIPFISSYSEAGFGLLFPTKKKPAANSCEFLGCNYEVNNMWKLNLANIFYLDKYEMNGTVDIAFEKKIGKSPFSINSNLIINLNFQNTYIANGVRDTLIYDKKETDRYLIWEYFKENVQMWETGAIINEQIRFYPSQIKRNSLKNTTSNLNGLFMGAFCEFGFRSRFFKDKPLVSVNELNRIARKRNIGIVFGYQSKVSRKSFIEFLGHFGVFQMSDYQPFYPINASSFNRDSNYLNLGGAIKLGLAK
jgi:hypothetical protein